jgi:hypothetical protein
MTKNDEFHIEEYRQLRAEWLTFIGRNEVLARYGFVGAALVYSWLVSEGFGHSLSGPCLELPREPLKWAWHIPAALTFLTGCLAGTQTYRAYKITQYLKEVEKQLGHSNLGWEKWISSTPSVLTIGIGGIWLLFFVGTILVGSFASHYIGSIEDFCPVDL